MRRQFFVILGIFGFLSFLFQLIGLFSPEWLVFDMETNYNDTKASVNIGFGLFSTRVCAESVSGKNCSTFFRDKMPNIKYDTLSDLVEAFELQLLTVSGGIGSLIATILMTMYANSAPTYTNRKAHGHFAAILWIFCGCLSMRAVGLQAIQYTFFKVTFMWTHLITDPSYFQAHFPLPRCIVVTGIGAILSLLCGAMLEWKLNSRPSVLTWNPPANTSYNA